MSARRRLAVYRGWLLLNTVLAVCLVLLMPPALFARGFHDPSVVLPGVGLLIAWWLTFVAAWCAWQRVPRQAPVTLGAVAATRVVHSSAKEPTVTTSPQPSKPAPVRKVWTWVIVAVVAVVVWIVIASNSDQPADPQAAPPAPTGAAAVLKAAGPLHAHVENTNHLICDSATATIAESGRGFRVHVDFPGPGNLAVAATSVDSQDANETYTVGAQETGHDFAFSQFPLSKVQVASVSVTAAAGGGTCDVVDRRP